MRRIFLNKNTVCDVLLQLYSMLLNNPLGEEKFPSSYRNRKGYPVLYLSFYIKLLAIRYLHTWFFWG